LITSRDNIRRELQKLQGEKLKLLILGMRKFFGAVAGHLVKKVPFSNNVLQNNRILQPLRRKE